MLHHLHKWQDDSQHNTVSVVDKYNNTIITILYLFNEIIYQQLLYLFVSAFSLEYMYSCMYA